ncbi:MAG: type II toxin-antitoxin system RelE/ParE family toxin [Spirochaetaceae bacterium]|jgi:putative addiction module killer protein|nr:type II toxin-antitoxin system RelE/ParE family toxin [Spirochaetaceae bacterium]
MTTLQRTSTSLDDRRFINYINYVEIRETETFRKWFSGLRDGLAKRRIDMRIKRLAMGNPGDVASAGEGVSEMRIFYGPGYRVYFKDTGKEIIILLCGGDKSTQSADIEKARDLARDY